ncbi:MAG: MFS transporter, partial [Syntrophales bacterium]|nr:MFS transporter [Syntrophales bacterium]
MKIQESNQFHVGGPRATFVMVICALLYAVNYMDRQVMTVVLQPMKIDLGLTDFQVGLVNTMFYIGIIVFCMPIAHFVDVWSRKKMIGLMAFAWSIFTLATGFCNGFVTLLLTRLGVGVGESGFAAGGTALIAASYPEEKRAQKLGLFNMFITIGIIVGVILGGYLSANYGGWRTPFYIFGIPGIILGVLAFFMQDYSLKKADGSVIAHDSFTKNLKQLLKIKTLRWLYLGLGMFAILQFSIMTWFPALLMRAYHVKEDKAGLVVGLVSIIGLLGPILGGILADRWQKKRSGGRMRLAAVSIAISAIFLMLVLLAVFDLGNKNLLIFCAIMMPLHSVFGGMAFPAASATTQDVVTPNLKGLSSGTSYLAMMVLGGAWGPALVGGLSDSFGGGYQGLTYALYVSTAFGFLAAAFWWISARHCNED